MYSRRVTSLMLVFSMLCGGFVNANEYRLTNDAIPKEQSVFLALDPEQDDFSGHTTIDVNIPAKTSSLTLNALDMTIDKASISTSKVSFDLTAEQQKHGIVKLSSAQPIPPGSYQLTIEFSAPYNRQSVGLYKTVEKDIGYLFTQFEMSDARRAFPVFDEPSFKIPFQLSISSPKHQRVFNNTPEVKTEASKKRPGWTIHHFEKTPPMPSYIVAMAVGPFESMPIEGFSIPGKLLTTKGKIEQGQFAAKAAPKILDYMEQYFGRPYPYKKLDMIALPEYPFGAMENAGLITYRDDILLLDEEHSTVARKTTSAMVIAHEIAHMWYGDLVTMKWWNDLWLNEAFASWMATKATIDLFPEFEYHLRLPQSGVLLADAFATSKPIRKKINTEADIMDGLGLAYSKGESVLSMIEMWLGKEAFQRGIQNYINKFAWKNTEASDLWDNLSAASGKDVAAVLKSFTEQPGFPLITASLDGKTLTLTQKRFANHGSKVTPFTWSLPVRVSYGKGSKKASTVIVLNDSSASVKLDFKPDWIFPDADAVGYYRWNMDADALKTLSEQATDVLNTRERLALISNTKALLDAGALSGADYINTVAQFVNDKSPQVVNYALIFIDELKDPLVNTNNQQDWARFIQRTFTPAVKQFGLESREGEKENVSRLRPNLFKSLAIDGASEDLIAISKKQAQAYLKDPKSVDSAMAATWLRVATYFGDEALLNKTIAAFEVTTDPATRTNLLIAIGSFNDEKVHQKAMNYILSEKVTASDVRYLLWTNAAYKHRRKRLQTWAMQNYDKLAAKLPPFVIVAVPGIVGDTCDMNDFNNFKSFIVDNGFMDKDIERSFQKLEASVTQCVTFKSRNLKSFNQYLSQ